MALIADRRKVEEHNILGKIVPLKMPFVLVLDPSNLCNHRCKFCPTGDDKLIRSTNRWNGDVLSKARLEQLNGNIKNMIFCQNCEVITHGTLDNLDPYREEILKRFKENIYN